MLIEVNEDLNKRTYHVNVLEDLNNVKVAVRPNMDHRFNRILIKILADFFVKIDKLILKFTWKFKGLRIAKIILKKKKEHPHFLI